MRNLHVSYFHPLYVGYIGIYKIADTIKERRLQWYMVRVQTKEQSLNTPKRLKESEIDAACRDVAG